MRIFKCANGNEYECSDTACVFCDYCLEIIYDSQGPFLIFCKIPDHDCHGGAGCEHFKEVTHDN